MGYLCPQPERSSRIDAGYFEFCFYASWFSCFLGGDPQKCLEERLEILQGKISLLEDQLAKLKESSSSLPEKGEVMGDVLKVGARLGL